MIGFSFRGVNTVNKNPETRPISMQGVRSLMINDDGIAFGILVFAR
jgi:hypothetical protein